MAEEDGSNVGLIRPPGRALWAAPTVSEALFLHYSFLIKMSTE